MAEKNKTKELRKGIYRHYKNNNYKVLMEATHSETEEALVVYEDKNKRIWVRPKKMFTEMIEVDGEKVPRFQFMEEVNDDPESMYKRALADYHNLLKQVAKEKQEFAKYANEQLLYDMIPVYDNLKMSLEHIDEDKDLNSWLEGIKYVIKQFKDVLESVGVCEIKTQGEEFDPKTMEAIDGKGTKVVKEIKSGYLLNGKVIIPAKVILS